VSSGLITRVSRMSATDMETPPFGLLLRRFRVDAGPSQEALAERARMSACG
jgi:hypothetical protein